MSQYDEVLCHCGHGSGHTPGEDGCEEPTIKRGAWARSPIERIAVGGNSQREIRARMPGARGTCPVCRKPGVRVRAMKVVTADREDLHPLMPGVLIAVRPGMASHKVGGMVCAGERQVPVETRYRSVALEKMIRDFGPESVEVR